MAAGIFLSARQKRRIARHLKHGRTLAAQRIILDELHGTRHHTRHLIFRGWL